MSVNLDYYRRRNDDGVKKDTGLDWWYLHDMWIICEWYLDDIWIICGWYVDDMWMICGWYVGDMWLICGWYVDDMWANIWIICGWYRVDDMWVISGWNMGDMWMICGWYLDDMWVIWNVDDIWTISFRYHPHIIHISSRYHPDRTAVIWCLKHFKNIVWLWAWYHPPPPNTSCYEKIMKCSFQMNPILKLFYFL